ncbi:hypothetical protein [Gluconobacter morbifer]|uniref:Secreted protein n=1 Tax=Gluconobacter morbifer G707 TaxID=1088869 RepID=G6XJI4_9PROT|nr:hypothetical protein [Gluconobacter morbifer]EHH68089.1 hypothetical protein GMO_18560 [Gluconobacter morbifer G707]
MSSSIFIRSLLSAAVIAGAVAAAPLANADDSSTSTCNQTGSTDMVGRLTRREDCLNDRVRKYQENSQKAQQEREQRIQNLKDKYANAPARERERLQNQINGEQSKLNTMRNQQTQRIDQFRNAGQQNRQELNNLGSKTRGDVNNLLNGGL